MHIILSFRHDTITNRFYSRLSTPNGRIDKPLIEHIHLSSMFYRLGRQFSIQLILFYYRVDKFVLISIFYVPALVILPRRYLNIIIIIIRYYC